MPSTQVIDEERFGALAAKLTTLDDLLDDDEKLALLAIFELAGEALTARFDDQAEVSGYALGGMNIGVQVQAPDHLPGTGDGLMGIVGRKAGKGQQEFLVVKLDEVFISNYSG